MMNYRALTVFVAALIVNVPAVAETPELRLQSGPAPIALLELYTSEGCSSCPPADRWMSDLKDDPRLWLNVVPIAFHVDYWDYIGWPDRFADAAYGQRQRRYAAVGAVRSVYTPGLIMAGREWRGWFVDPTLRLEGETAAVGGELGVQVQLQAGTLSASYAPPSRDFADRRLKLHLALLGFDLATQVAAGENHGRELHHDFVVLGHNEVTFDRDTDSTASVLNLNFRATAELPTPAPSLSLPSGRRALAAWVSDQTDPTPLQAVGGWLR